MPDKVLVTRKLPGSALDRLAALVEIDVWTGRFAPPRAELLARAADCRGLLSMITDRVDGELLAAAPELRVVSNYAVGYDNIDVEACAARGVVVGNTPGVLTESTADQTWALILAASRRVPEAAAAVKAGEWRAWEPDFLLGRDVHGATLGVVGFGAVGRAVARRAEGFGMRVLYHDPVVGGLALEDLLRQSDVVTLHCPLTDETHRLIGERELALMKPTAVLVNAARGPIVDQKALTRALQERQIFAAGLDVTEVEPIASDDPLLSLPNCVVLPHLGSATYATRGAMAEMAVDNLLAGLAGEPLPNAVHGRS
ncbi:D-glycerate dehydrogenase [Streptosporangium violaceochromogenes]|nr:D-glycerate dehydrogenase [Streptosporangium violaceochromogenes]